ncbi:hypothetical protein CEUSTIGMA_g12851.t1 [Chlamydomonas eustigma]|uniref:Micro-fibrillar-associated protein 1 C-terminal domain-containing protein n=1 Tax=Chlamydomonas eustigma TaxID=1157962 RepID=A0A250XQV2_9CHLO|nr:hypothetical protein CEUSTIGMA_g12851.t1 [Chlamydomonas eustigma]|eukprot:GAX85435.1 hypothetical protein CEUSTIGMA_g12851.t1 [Chlamydomonas eustigma]
MSGALAARAADVESDKGRVAQTKVRRYWAGRAPDWSDAHEQGDQTLQESGPRERTRTETAPVIIKKTDDPRLRRLAQTHHRDEDIEDALQRRREIRAAEVVRRKRGDEDDEDAIKTVSEHVSLDQQVRTVKSEPAEEEAEDQVPSSSGRHPADQEDDDELIRRRQSVREKLLLQQRQQDEALAAATANAQLDDEEDNEDSESEYETDSEDEAAGVRLLKPVFVPKVARETIAEREALALEEEQQAEKERRRLAERKQETQQIVRATISLEEMAAREAAQGPQQIEDVDTDDDKDPADSYEGWKQRELKRIKRDREEKEKLEKEIQERERLRSMTDAEREAWDRANPKAQKQGEKKKLRFLQKYWHKGAYFQEGADDERSSAGGYEIFQRDYSAPTGEDKFDRAILPEVMQVKNFGRAGRTKWKHLVAEDTTYQALMQDDPMIQSLKEASRKREELGARPEDFKKPKKFKM